MDRIERGLYIGDLADAADHDLLRECGVANVLNVARVRPDEGYPATVAVRHVPLIDGTENAYDDFEDAVEVALALLDAEGAALVHCAVGVSRSVAVAAAALAARDARPVGDVLEDLVDCRPVANPHPHLRRQAERYAEARSRARG